MKNTIFISGLLGVALFAAGSALAAERTLTQTKVEGDLEVKTNISVEGRTPRPQEVGERDDEDRVDVRLTATTTRARVEMENRERRGDDGNDDDVQGTSTREREEGRKSATSSRERDDDKFATSSREDDEDDSATSTRGERTREEHRSTVAKAVQELLSVADREGGIGAQVRTIAKSQEDNHEKISESLKKVEERGAIRKFFFGPDQAEIESAKQLVASNEAQIKLLADLKTRMATGTDQAVIDTQIKLLQDVNLAASTSLTVHEGGFSVFGWMFRLFGR
ncbi:MAG TPA: hypothetical protein VJ579_04875 [Candidatus Paceibacterota bacterium]|nr:hypothetical protein [Candidatus Paceibacterota bacterium]